MRRPVVRTRARTLLRIVLACLLLEAALIVSPVDVLVRSHTLRMVLDGDILTAVPAGAPVPAGGRAGVERVCSYWGGGAMLHPVLVPAQAQCALFRPKPARLRLFGPGPAT